MPVYNFTTIRVFGQLVSNAWQPRSPVSEQKSADILRCRFLVVFLTKIATIAKVAGSKSFKMVLNSTKINRQLHSLLKNLSILDRYCVAFDRC